MDMDVEIVTARRAVLTLRGGIDVYSAPLLRQRDPKAAQIGCLGIRAMRYASPGPICNLQFSIFNFQSPTLR